MSTVNERVSEEIVDYKKLNKELRAILKRNQNNSCLEEFKAFLDRYDDEKKSFIIHCNEGTKPIIFKAIKYKNMEVLEYLLNDCGADIEVVMTYHKELGNSFDVTPVYYAALLGDMDLIKFLQDKGADMFSQDEDGLMPIHGAVRKNYLHVVDHFVKCVEKLHVEDSATLLAYLPNEKMLNYLLSKGLDPNKKNCNGFTSLHEAIMYSKQSIARRSTNYKTVMMLVHAGADINIKDNEGLDAILTAAKEDDKTSFYFLSSQVNARRTSVIDGYELLGTHEIYDAYDVEKGFKHWQKALFMRYSDITCPVLKPPTEPKEIFEFAIEFQTFDELEALHGKDKITLFNQAALIMERVIGWNHPGTLYKLYDRFAEKLLKKGKYRQAFKMLMYARNGYLEWNNLDYRSVLVIESIVKALYKSASFGVREISQQEILELLSLILKQWKDFDKEIEAILHKLNTNRSADSQNISQESTENQKEIIRKTDGELKNTMQNNEAKSMDCSEEASKNDTFTATKTEEKTISDEEDQQHGPNTGNKSSEDDKNYSSLPTYELEDRLQRYGESFGSLFSNSLNIFFYVLAMSENLKFDKESKALFCRFINEDIRGYLGESMLHSVALFLSEREVSGNNSHQYKLKHPILSAMFDALLLHGASVDSYDCQSNTPIHYALRPVKALENLDGCKPKSAVKKLLKHGVHIDSCNDDGECSLDILRKMDYDTREVECTTLQCLSASAIMRYQLDYEYLVPRHLKQFI